MKIKLKITSAELLYLESKAQEVMAIRFNDIEREKKASYTIMLDVSDKVSKNARALNRDFTSNKKPHSLSLKYHEAHVLELFLVGFEETHPYNANMARKIISQLNQKLA